MGTRKNYVINAGGAYSIEVGAEQPAPGVTGRLYIDTSDGVIYLDTGANWEPLQMGPAGDVGPPGPAGDVGPPGVSDYLYVYRTGAGTVQAGTNVVFSSTGPFTTNFTHLNDEVRINTPGVYKAIFTVSAQGGNLLFSLMLGNTGISGGTYRSVGNDLIGQVIFTVTSATPETPAIVRLRNTGSNATFSNFSGAVAGSSASLSIIKLLN